MQSLYSIALEDTDREGKRWRWPGRRRAAPGWHCAAGRRGPEEGRRVPGRSREGGSGGKRGSGRADSAG